MTVTQQLQVCRRCRRRRRRRHRHRRRRCRRRLILVDIYRRLASYGSNHEDLIDSRPFKYL